MKNAISLLFGIIMVIAGINHFMNPEIYSEMIPPFIPELFANVSSGVIEILIGLSLLFSPYRKFGGLAFCVLMIIFFPLHIWDMVREEPAIGSRLAAYIRAPIQVLLVYIGWWIYKD
ncbi:DoxX family protein [Marinigracilibium pacificum]|uniref:Methylamine utilisation protein MauE domain-containing protein n=1 Tax=Marinigracilibium pacificum TaxID=2729599 RepID=A0A848IYY0_9BACT|nr:MauE/DoxX family redox-associated membrane protein [Marinigracilibium pacificum]NMM48551.1 hypothetical protein [Marinigracilibium pacificum]